MVTMPLTCPCLMVVGVIRYQIDTRAAGGVLHPSPTVMATPVLWRWGTICLIAGVFRWVLMACADAMRPLLLPSRLDDYPGGGPRGRAGQRVTRLLRSLSCAGWRFWGAHRAPPSWPCEEANCPRRRI